MTMLLTSVTMVGWVDVQDSDQGDFRRWRADDISSFNIFHIDILTGDPLAKHIKSGYMLVVTEK